MKTNNYQFLVLELFTDEVSFNCEGIFNIHSQHISAKRNSLLSEITKRDFPSTCQLVSWWSPGWHSPVGRSFDKWKVAGLPGESASYFLLSVPLITQKQMWFPHDCASAHITVDALLSCYIIRLYYHVILCS